MDHSQHTPGGHAHDEHDGHHGVGHVVSPKILIATAAALLVLTVVTVASAKIDFNDFDLREMNIVVALTIAVIKASLVCLFFMHLRWDRPFNSFVLVCSLAFVALFIGFAMTDSSEYMPDVIKGDTETVTTKLNEPKVKPAGHDDHGHDHAPAPDAAGGTSGGH
jgi:cytochrome c oxidase subunit 4